MSDQCIMRKKELTAHISLTNNISQNIANEFHYKNSNEDKTKAMEKMTKSLF